MLVRGEYNYYSLFENTLIFVQLDHILYSPNTRKTMPTKLHLVRHAQVGPPSQKSSVPCLGPDNSRAYTTSAAHTGPLLTPLSPKQAEPNAYSSTRNSLTTHKSNLSFPRRYFGLSTQQPKASSQCSIEVRDWSWFYCRIYKRSAIFRVMWGASLRVFGGW